MESYKEHLEYLGYKCKDTKSDDVIYCEKSDGIVSVLLFRSFGIIVLTSFEMNKEVDETSALVYCNKMNEKMLMSKVYITSDKSNDKSINHEALFFVSAYDKKLFADFMNLYNSDMAIMKDYSDNFIL